eukprot:TRINITY_DN3224_c0_g1_i1.p1 TRINITY_DN3224_c0_g1~~TRINITY_DN3224_c0_g1_i1.p1  ORF type:complete len:109 (-),score=28.93 TRINITY_DN3224_c0_g1_i1:114-440(-)
MSFLVRFSYRLLQAPTVRSFAPKASLQVNSPLALPSRSFGFQSARINGNQRKQRAQAAIQQKKVKKEQAKIAKLNFRNENPSTDKLVQQAYRELRAENRGFRPPQVPN